MTENNSQAIVVEQEINSRKRGPRGCFAGFFARFLSLFKKKDRRHSKGKNGDPRKHSEADLTSKTENLVEKVKVEEKIAQLKDCIPVTIAVQEQQEQADLEAENILASKEELESKVVKTWVEDVDEAEQLALDVFTETSGTVTTVMHSDITASTECEAECESAAAAAAAASTHIKINASKRRRARLVAAAAARRESRPSCAETSQNDAAQDYYHYYDRYYRYYNQEEVAQDYYRYYESSNQEEASSDYYRYYESTNHYVEAQEYYQYYDNLNQHEGAQDYYRYYQTSNQDEAAYDYYQRVRQEQRRDMVPAEVPYRRPTRPSPSVRVFGRDGRPLVCQWEDGYAAFHAQRHTKGKAAH